MSNLINMKEDNKYEILVNSLVEELNNIYSDPYRHTPSGSKNEVTFEYKYAVHNNEEEPVHEIILHIRENNKEVGIVGTKYIGEKETAFKCFYTTLLRYIILVKDFEYTDMGGIPHICKSLKTLYNGKQ